MAGKSDFTEEEWAALQKGITGAAMFVSLADRGFFETFKEVGALAKHLREAHDHSSSALMRDLAEVRHSGFGWNDKPEEVERETLDALRSSLATLEAKAPDETQAYRDLVVEVAESVAAAAGGVDTKETDAIGKIKDVLQAT